VHMHMQRDPIHVKYTLMTSRLSRSGDFLSDEDHFPDPSIADIHDQRTSVTARLHEASEWLGQSVDQIPKLPHSSRNITTN
jgi:hypothetical protein